VEDLLIGYVRARSAVKIVRVVAGTVIVEREVFGHGMYRL
jgi:hypothetical protein